MTVHLERDRRHDRRSRSTTTAAGFDPARPRDLRRAASGSCRCASGRPTSAARSSIESELGGGTTVRAQGAGGMSDADPAADRRRPPGGARGPALVPRRRDGLRGGRARPPTSTARSPRPSALQPDVVLLDLVMPGGGGVAALPAPAGARPRARASSCSPASAPTTRPWRRCGPAPRLARQGRAAGRARVGDPHRAPRRLRARPRGGRPRAVGGHQPAGDPTPASTSSRRASARCWRCSARGSPTRSWPLGSSWPRRP